MSLKTVATPDGVVVQMSAQDWRARLKHELEWHDVHERAKRCEVP